MELTVNPDRERIEAIADDLGYLRNEPRAGARTRRAVECSTVKEIPTYD